MSTRKCQDNLKSQILVTVASKMEIDLIEKKQINLEEKI